MKSSSSTRLVDMTKLGGRRKLIVMKKFFWCLFTLAMQGLLFPQTTFGYVVTRDQSQFLSSYSNPTEVVTFDSPLAGSLTGTSYSLPGTGGQSAYEVRADGWSSSFIVGSLHSGSSCCWEATTWYGDYVSTTLGLGRFDVNNRRIYLRSNIAGAVYSLSTSDGFYGLESEGPADNFFALPPGVTLTEIAFNFSPVSTVPVSTVPEPASALLFGAGLGSMYLTRRRKLAC